MPNDINNKDKKLDEEILDKEVKIVEDEIEELKEISEKVNQIAIETCRI